MQNGADSAAIEGLRKRDVGIRNPVTGVTINDPFASDCLRRAAANRMVRWTFDDDLDPTNGDPDYQFGAGPNIELTEGSTNLHALQTISVPDEHSYKPSPQLNQRNQVHGDMVSGRFCYTSDPAPSEGGAYEVQDIVCTEPQRGTGAYARNDFNPNATSPGGPATLAECPDIDEDVPTPWPLGGTGTLDGVDDSAFLVRLRRSNDAPEPGIASSGSSLPLLFGKGAPVAGDNPDSAYSVRRDGFTVRATAISQTRPAFSSRRSAGEPAHASARALRVAGYVLADADRCGSHDPGSRRSEHGSDHSRRSRRADVSARNDHGSIRDQRCGRSVAHGRPPGASRSRRAMCHDDVVHGALRRGVLPDVGGSGADHRIHERGFAEGRSVSAAAGPLLCGSDYASRVDGGTVERDRRCGGPVTGRGAARARRRVDGQESRPHRRQLRPGAGPRPRTVNHR
jgi:hypothetical protein